MPSFVSADGRFFFELAKHLPLILAAVSAAHGKPKAHEDTSKIQAAMREAGGDWARIADRLDRVLSGDHDESIVEELDYDTALILMTIIPAIEDPSTLNPLLALAEKAGVARKTSRDPGRDEG